MNQEHKLLLILENMMKILFVTPSYYPAIGRVEIQARLMAQELAKKHQVSIAVANFGFRHPQYVPGWLEKKMRIESLYNNLLAPTYIISGYSGMMLTVDG